MAIEFEQRRGFTRRTYQLVDDGLRVTERTWLSSRTVVVTEDLLLASRTELVTSSKRAFWLMVISVVVAGGSQVQGLNAQGGIFWLALAVLSGCAFALSRQVQTGFADDSGKHVMFFSHGAERSRVDAFVEQALVQVRKRIRDRIFPLVASGHPATDRARANWLHEKGIILDSERDEFLRGCGLVEGPRHLPQATSN